MSTTTPSSAPSRRQALRLGAGATLAAGTALAAGATPAAAVSYEPGRYAATTVLDPADRHLLNRFSYGITPQLVAEVRAAGGHLAWFDRQLETAYDGSADGLCDWWPALRDSAPTLWSRNVANPVYGEQLMWNYGRRVLARRVVSPRQVLEVMTEFWENHFHVPTVADNVFTLRAPYGEVLRAHALGRFEDLLQAAVLDPAMLMFLGGATSTKAHPNENLGRELLELHTVGVGSYTEADVQDSARILTGWRVDLYRSWAPSYADVNHWTGPVRVMGFSHANAAPDGRDVTRRYLAYLAHHPATARRIATRLVRVFVSDDVPAGLVDRLAATYLAHDTAIVPVLRELVRAPEFAAAVDRKLRDGAADVVATYRLLGVRLAAPSAQRKAALQLYWNVAGLGLELFTWPRPDGQPVDNASWASPTRALASMAFHWRMAGRYATSDPSYPRPVAWLPRSSLTFRDFVDHLSRLLLHRPSTEVLLRACCEATELSPTARVTPRSDLFTVRWTRLVAAILDSPAFYQH